MGTSCFFGKRSLQRHCAYFSTSDQTPFHSAHGAVTRNRAMRSRNSLLGVSHGTMARQSSNPASALSQSLRPIRVERLDIGVTQRQSLARNLTFAAEQLENALRLGLTNNHHRMSPPG
jgi:hypothetical protein